MSGSDLVVNGLWQIFASLQGKQLFRQLAGQTICRIFVGELLRSVLNKRRHLSSVGVGTLDYVSAPFVCWENHDGLVFFQDFKCFSHILRDIRLWWFCLLKDTSADHPVIPKNLQLDFDSSCAFIVSAGPLLFWTDSVYICFKAK